MIHLTRGQGHANLSESRITTLEDRNGERDQREGVRLRGWDQGHGSDWKAGPSRFLPTMCSHAKCALLSVADSGFL